MTIGIQSLSLSLRVTTTLILTMLLTLTTSLCTASTELARVSLRIRITSLFELLDSFRQLSIARRWRWLARPTISALIHDEKRNRFRAMMVEVESHDCCEIMHTQEKLLNERKNSNEALFPLEAESERTCRIETPEMYIRVLPSNVDENGRKRMALA